jgi:hypothetical protein
MFATGSTLESACKDNKVGPRYFRRIMKAPIGKDYYALMSKRVEDAFVDKASAVVAADQGRSASVDIVQNEIDESVLEAVQELRSIIKTSKSDSARAEAAKQLLDLAQAKKRYLAGKAGESADVELTADDVAAFGHAVADLRSLSMTPTRAGVESAIKTADGAEAHSDDPITRAVDAAVDAAPAAAEIVESAAQPALPPSGPNDDEDQ